ncbi:uncharacterized protein LOC114317745 [Camellia sinensis]|uniref:uncharacterized protein LOC114317745 n=1 Tax=Camellia sinensis TaxID=4442 RepID=UPI001036C692|nr:uncharacterized protein LOC114317745 [Camellia sinensis]
MQAVSTVFRIPIYKVLEGNRNQPYYRTLERIPGKFVGSSTGKHCAYHNKAGHLTQGYKAFKSHMEDLVRQGYLRDLVDEANENKVRGKAQRLMHQHHVYQIEQKKPRTDEYQRLMISVTEANLDIVLHPHNDALVVTLKIGDYQMKCILIDQGSTCHIMYVRCYKELVLY